MDATGPAVLEIGLLLLGAVAAGWVARRLGLPAIVGYLCLGLAVSPFTPGFVAERHQLELLADVGVVLLLFEVGVEVDVGCLRREHGPLLAIASLQTILTTALSALALVAAGIAPLAAAILGLCVALSSSVVIVNITRSQRRTTDRDTESALLGWSVLQDLTGVILAGVLLAGLGSGDRSVLERLVGLGLFGLLTVAVAQVVPVVLRHLHRESDFFLIVSVAGGLAIAGIGSVWFGVPLALAAFVAGLAVTDSREAAEARRRMLPFRDLFAVLFFVAIGTLIDPSRLVDGLGWLALFLGLLVVTKLAVAFGLTRIASVHARPLQLAIGLGQVGEFSFVLASAAAAAGAIGDETYTAMVATVAVSIAVSTVAVRLVGRRPTSAAAT